MSYVVLARKWRPSAFDEVVGQDHIVTTLRNAISGGRVGHAYIFTGPRGIGKTSTARILARALNCQKGPAVDPCGKCPSCREITAGTSMDVIEIDGASNNGVDEVRTLRENVKFSPVYGKFKVYIIDEVHMLTTGAFNALLKTLEEPPAHVKFVFATTHPEKVPPTILSRCQRFDFKRISLNDIMATLATIAKSEKISIEDEAIFAIAAAAEGSLRDAESVLDQIVSFSKGKISRDNVIEALGLIDEDVIFETVDTIAKKDAAGLLKIVDRLIDAGKDITQYLTGLLGHFRNLMILKTSLDLKKMVDLPEDRIERLVGQTGLFGQEEMLYIFYTLASTAQSVRRSDVARFLLESAFLKLARRENIMQVGDLVRKIDAMKTSSGGGGGPSRTVPERRAGYAQGGQDVFRRQERAPEGRAQKPLSQDRPKQGFRGRNGDAAAGAVSAGQATAVKDPAQVAAIDINEVRRVWNEAIQALKGVKISIASYLLEGDPVAVEGDKVVIGFAPQYNFHKEVLEHTDNRNLIEKTFARILGHGMRIEFKTLKDAPLPADGINAAAEGDETATDDVSGENVLPQDSNGRKASRDIFSEPVIQSAIEMFDGRIVPDNGKDR